MPKIDKQWTPNDMLLLELERNNSVCLEQLKNGNFSEKIEVWEIL